MHILLKQLRLRAGIGSQSQLSKLSGVSQQQISRIERTGVIHSCQDAERIAKALGVPAASLISAADSDSLAPGVPVSGARKGGGKPMVFFAGDEDEKKHVTDWECGDCGHFHPRRYQGCPVSWRTRNLAEEKHEAQARPKEEPSQG